MAEKLSGSIGSESVRLEYSSKASLDDIYKQLEAQTKLLEKCCGRGGLGRRTPQGGADQGVGNNVQQVANTLSNRMGIVGKAFGLLGSVLSTLTKGVIGAVTGIYKFATAIGGAILDSLLGLAQAFGSLLSWANDTEHTLSGFTQGLFNLTKTLTSNIPLIGGALTTLIATFEAAFQPVFQILEQNIGAFQELNRAGIDLGSGLMTAKTAAIQAGMTLGDFTRVVANNSEKLAAFGGDASTGAQRFADIMGRAYRSGTGVNLAKLGYTASEAAEYLTSYLEQQRLLGNVQGKSNQELADGAQQYLKELDKLARVTGMSRAEAQRALDQQKADLSLNAKLLTLQPQAQGELKKLIAAFEKAAPAVGEGLRDLIRFDGGAISEAGQALADAAPSLAKNAQLVAAGQMSAEQALAALDEDAQRQMQKMRAEGKSAAQIAAMGNKFEEIRIAVAGMAGQFKNATKVSAEQQKALQDGDKALSAFNDAMTEIKNAIFSFLSGTGIFEIATEYLQGFVSMLRTGTPELTATLRGIVDEFKRVFGISDKKEQGERAENKMLQIKDTIIKGLQSMVPYIQKLKDFFDKVVASFKQGFNEGGIWGGIKAAFGTIMSPLWESLKNTLISFWDEYSPTVISYLKDAFKNVMSLFGEIALDGLKRMPGLIWDGIKGVMKNLWGAITGAVIGWFSGASLGGLIGGVVGSFFGPLGTAIGAQIGGIIGSWFGAIGGGLIGNGLQEILEMLWSGIKTAWNVVTDLATKGVNGIKNMFTMFVEEMQLWIAGMMKFIPGLRDKGKELEESVLKAREQRSQAAMQPQATALSSGTAPQTNLTFKSPEEMSSMDLENWKAKIEKQGPRSNSQMSKDIYDNKIKLLDQAITQAREREKLQRSEIPQAEKGGKFSGPSSGYLVELHDNEFVLNEDKLKGKKVGDVSLGNNFDLGLPKLEDSANSLVQQYLKLEGQLSNLAVLKGSSKNTYVDASPEVTQAQDKAAMAFDNLKNRLGEFGINVATVSADFNKSIDTISKNWNESVQQDMSKKSEISDVNSKYKAELDILPKLVNQLQTVTVSPTAKDGDNNLATAMNELNSKLAVLIDLQSKNNKIADDQLDAVKSYSGDLFKAL